MVVRPCLDCHQPTSHGSRCPTCEQLHRAKFERYRNRGTAKERGYTARFYRNRDALIAEGAGCAWAHLGDCGGPLTGDHIIRPMDGGTDDDSNIRIMCQRHNSIRGAQMRATRRPASG